MKIDNEQLKQQRHRLGQTCLTNSAEIHELEQERDQLKQQVKVLRGALEFYGDPAKYITTLCNRPSPSDIAKDEGQKARDALACAGEIEFEKQPQHESADSYRSYWD